MARSPISSYVAGRPRYKVVGPLVVVRPMTGGELYLKKGALVPANIDDEQLDRLVELRMIRLLETGANK